MVSAPGTLPCGRLWGMVNKPPVPPAVHRAPGWLVHRAREGRGTYPVVQAIPSVSWERVGFGIGEP